MYDIQRARDDFMRWKRLKASKEVSPAYEKIVSTLVSQNDAKHLVKLRLPSVAFQKRTNYIFPRNT